MKRQEDEAYQKMRGREELIIKALGGPDYGPTSITRARNKIRELHCLIQKEVYIWAKHYIYNRLPIKIGMELWTFAIDR
ncbi:MAG: hypothetical protein IPN89_00100 [Saprospiraceae bacterium]|nr:hypothetical protein [Saprospiraceae bacterium]